MTISFNELTCSNSKFNEFETKFGGQNIWRIGWNHKASDIRWEISGPRYLRCQAYQNTSGDE